MTSLVEIIKPDVVVFETAERMLDYAMPLLVTDSKKMSVEYIDFESLPVLDNPEMTTKPIMWLDTSNDKPVPTQGKLLIDKNATQIVLTGRAIDPRANLTAEGVFVQVGAKYMTATYGIPAPSVSDHFNNPLLLNSGFSVTINAAELKDISKISFIIVANNKKYQYMPADFWIERQ